MLPDALRLFHSSLFFFCNKKQAVGSPPKALHQSPSCDLQTPFAPKLGPSPSLDDFCVAVCSVDHMRSSRIYHSALASFASYTSTCCLLFRVKHPLFIVCGPERRVATFLKYVRTQNVDINSKGQPCRERLLRVWFQQQLQSPCLSLFCGWGGKGAHAHRSHRGGREDSSWQSAANENGLSSSETSEDASSIGYIGCRALLVDRLQPGAFHIWNGGVGRKTEQGDGEAVQAWERDAKQVLELLGCADRLDVLFK